MKTWLEPEIQQPSFETLTLRICYPLRPLREAYWGEVWHARPSSAFPSFYVALDSGSFVNYRG